MRRKYRHARRAAYRACIASITVLLALVFFPVSAQLTFEQFWLSSDIPVRVPEPGSSAVTITTDRSLIVIGPDGKGDAQQNGALFDQPGADLDALDRFPTRFSIDTARVINGVLISPGDVFFASGTNPPIVFFDADAAGIPDGVNLDAVTQNPSTGNLAVSFDRFFEHPNLGFLSPADVIEVGSGHCHCI